MKIDAYIKKWLESWIISKEQAVQMFDDSREIIESEKKNRVAGMFGSVWAVVLGIWLILFIGSNWQEIPVFIKIISTLWLCALSAFGAYRFEELWDRPRTAWTLAFLASIFWWATVILVAQQYSTWDNSKIHYIILMWMAGIIPAIYAFNSAATAWLFAVLTMSWVSSYVSFFRWDSEYFSLLAAGLILYWLWGLHYAFPKYQRIWRVYRIIWLYVSMFIFLVFSVFRNYEFHRATTEWLGRFGLPFAVAGAFILMSAYIARKNYYKSLLEHLPAIVWIILAAWALFIGSNTSIDYYNYNNSDSIFLPIFIAMNAYIVIISTLVLWIWYANRDSKLVNAGYFFWTIYLIVKYCEIWWWMMSASFFFIAWGIIFLTLWYFVERKRRAAITNFKIVWQSVDL
ncbi:MAG: hypothetical protein ACD_2C00247G0002 [uncultured bacterium (gcode 4)]|uniref:DUF2157 domain-containing protein n=1 Tax=uncultured bacterium (gcode 4) TaxID=1234023 RepID=K2GFE1_9BACT|nr:MAG: hypothetical protein ACD_2C00247G0002 [uncultured bacterium (gcode 4)]